MEISGSQAILTCQRMAIDTGFGIIVILCEARDPLESPSLWSTE